MTSPAVPQRQAALPNGGQMPLLGFGTWQLTGDDALAATTTALQAGYRHLDTATMYGNEAEVGRALRESGIPRDQVFLTTKLPPQLAGQERPTLEQSLTLLEVDAVDLWLVHWPPADEHKLSTWEQFGQAQADGLVRDIGVSNYSVELLDEITAATGLVPAVNQIKWSPLLFDPEVQNAHRQRGIVLEGYSGLRGGTLEDSTIQAIASRLGRTPAQVILRWHLQHDVVAIPKSSQAERIVSNADIENFELSAPDMALLDQLGVP